MVDNNDIVSDKLQIENIYSNITENVTDLLGIKAEQPELPDFTLNKSADTAVNKFAHYPSVKFTQENNSNNYEPNFLGTSSADNLK